MSWRVEACPIKLRPACYAGHHFIAFSKGESGIDALQLSAAIKTASADVDAALRVSLGPDYGLAPLSEALAGPLGERASRILTFLQDHGRLQSFETAFLARTAKLPFRSVEDSHELPAEATVFFANTVGSRCKVSVNGAFSGSGCLLGPSLVLTAAHVLSCDPAAPNLTHVQIIFHDNLMESVVPMPVQWGPCAEADLSQTPPSAFDYGDRDDFALLRLARPAGARYHNVRLPQGEAWKPNVGADISIVHFPDGTQQGVGHGRLTEITAPDARWRHDAVTATGSSGGACFNSRFELIGIHQGKWPPARRLVPLSRFLKRIREAVANDVSPPYLWSLDNTSAGELVIGRDDLVTAFAEMASVDSPFHGLRVKRLHPEGSAAGLGFTVEILKALTERSSGSNRMLAVSWSRVLDPGFDFITEVERAAVEAGWLSGSTTEPAYPDGAASGETGSAGTAKARADQLAKRMETAAEEKGRLSWIVVENAEAGLGGAHVELEALARAILVKRHLRLVILGLETVPTPGLERPASNPGPVPGSEACFMVELYGRFARTDVELTVQRAARDKVPQTLDDVVEFITDTALLGVPSILNGIYDIAQLPRVAEQLRPPLKALLQP